MGQFIREITNIQTYELIEERFGIHISGITASMVLEGDKYYVKINAEIMAINGGELNQNIEIQASISDSKGNVVGDARQILLKDDFFGIASLGMISGEYHYQDVQAIKVFPVKW